MPDLISWELMPPKQAWRNQENNFLCILRRLVGMGRVDRLRCIQVVPEIRTRLATGTLRSLVNPPGRFEHMVGNCMGNLVPIQNR
jgi:hypothetical protein